MVDPLHEMFHYHYWATFKLIDHLATLPPECLNDAVPGTAGSIHDTLAHLARADKLYISLMKNEGRPPRDSQDRTSTLDEFRNQFTALFEEWETILAHIDDYDPTLPAEDGEGPTPHVRNLLLTQAIHHGTDHRTHICTILGATGRDVPEMDEWAHWFSPEHREMS